jgi:hypothetical protein
VLLGLEPRRKKERKPLIPMVLATLMSRGRRDASRFRSESIRESVHPARYAANHSFITKMVVLVMAVLFQFTLYRRAVRAQQNAAW